jgi:hypothetical protein
VQQVEQLDRGEAVAGVAERGMDAFSERVAGLRR